MKAVCLLHLFFIIADEAAAALTPLAEVEEEE